MRIRIEIPRENVPDDKQVPSVGNAAEIFSDWAIESQLQFLPLRNTAHQNDIEINLRLRGIIQLRSVQACPHWVSKVSCTGVNGEVSSTCCGSTLQSDVVWLLLSFVVRRKLGLNY